MMHGRAHPPLVVVCALAVFFASISPDTLRARDAPYVRFLHEEVTPGAISAPVRALRYLPSGNNRDRHLWGQARLTEDRFLRVFDGEGTLVRSVRTGVRSARAILQDRSGFVSLIDRRGTIHRVSLDRETVRPVISLGVAPRNMWLDRYGNYFVISEEHEILHVSAAGNLLWRRTLPAECVGAGPVGRGLFVATGDRRVFRFDQTGRGQVVYQTDHPVLSLYASSVSRNDSVRLVTNDEHGSISAIAVDPDRSGRRLWTRETSPGSALVGVDGEGNTWVIQRDGQVAILDRDGSERAAVSVPGLDRDRAVLHARERRLYVVDDEDRLLTILPDGVVDGAIQLLRGPEKLRFVEETGELLVDYGDWRMAVYGTRRSAPVAGSIGSRADTGAVGDPRTAPDALTTLVDLVLEGSSQAERTRVLESLEERLDQQRLYGMVDSVRSAAVRLLEERDPDRFPSIRRSAASVLGAFLDLPARNALARAIAEDPDPGVASHALLVLAGYPADDVHALERADERRRTVTREGRRELEHGMLVYMEALTGAGGHFTARERSSIQRTSRRLAATAETEEARERLHRILAGLAR